VIPGTYDAQDRLLMYGNTSYTYNSNGDLASKTQNNATVTYDYDVFGNLRQVMLDNGQVIEYVIDGRNRRIGKKIDGALVQAFLYDDQLRPVAELDGSNQVVATFVYGTHVNVPELIVKGSTTYRIAHDHLGSPRLVSDQSTGAVVQRMDYDEWGIVTFDTNPGFQLFGFAGGIYDSQTKLVRFGHRDYDGALGRWTAWDPILHLGGQINLYEYSHGDPANLVDQTGLLCLPFVDWVDVGESAGLGALHYYVELINDPEGSWLQKGGGYLGGFFAALWTPCTSDKTLAAMMSAYGARAFGPFPTRGIPRWMQRGRRYFRFDPPHHGKGYHFDGDWVRWIGRQIGR
jgi:RHS repeat-associated protein